MRRISKPFMKRGPYVNAALFRLCPHTLQLILHMAPYSTAGLTKRRTDGDGADIFGAVFPTGFVVKMGSF